MNFSIRVRQLILKLFIGFSVFPILSFSDSLPKKTEIIDSVKIDEPLIDSLKQAKIYEKEGNVNDAISLYVALSKKYTKDLKYNLHLARLLIKSNRKKEAIPFYELVHKIKPKDLKFMEELAVLYSENQNLVSAVDMYQKILKIKKNNKVLQKKYMRLAERTGDRRVMILAYELITTQNPKAHDAHFKLAKVHHERRKNKLAYKHLIKALKIKPGNKTYGKLLPEVIELDKQIIESFQILQKLARKSKAEARTKYLCARGYMLKKNMKKAAALYKEVHRIDPSILDDDFNAINALYQTKNYSTASLLVENFVDRNPTNQKAIKLKVLCYEAAGVGNEKLRNAMENHVSVDTLSKNWWLKLARLQLAAGKEDLAIWSGIKWVRYHPKSVEGYKFLLPLVSKNKNKLETYIMVLENLIKLEPKRSADVSLRLGLIRYDQNNFNNAQFLLEKASKEYQKNPELWHKLGTIYKSRKIKRNGRAEFKKAWMLSSKNIVYARDYGGTLNTNQELKSNLLLLKMINNNSPESNEKLKLAKSYYLNNNYKSSSSIYEKMLIRVPDLFITEPFIITSFFKTKKYKSLVPIYEYKAAKFQNKIKILDTLASLYKKIQNKEKFMITADKIIGIDVAFGEYQLERARDRVKKGETQNAIRDYNKFVSRNPSHQKALKEYYTLADNLKDTSHQIISLKYLLKIKGIEKKYSYHWAELKLLKYSDPKDVEKLILKDEKYKLGKKLLIHHYYGKMKISKLVRFRKFMKSESKLDRNILPAYAEVLAHENLVLQANPVFYNAVIFHKKNKILFNRALSYSQKQNSPHIGKLLEVGNHSFPNDLIIKYQYAKSLGKTEKAIKEYLEILDKNKNHLEAIKSLIVLCNQLNKQDLAIKWLKKWNKVEPKNPKPLKSLAKYYKNKKDTKKLIEVLVSLFEIQNKDHELAFRIARLYKKNGRLKKSVKFYQFAANIQPSNRNYQKQLGLTLIKRKKFKKAVKPLLAAYSEEKFDEELEYALYLAYDDINDKRKSEKQLRRLVKNKPTEPKYAFPLVKLEDKKKNHQSAIKILEYPPLKAKLDLEITKLLILQYIKTNQLNKATTYGLSTAKKMPKALPEELGLYLYKNNKMTEAKRVIDLVIKNSGVLDLVIQYNVSPKTYYYRARIAHNEKDWNNAIKNYKKGKKYSKEYNNYLAQCYLKKSDYKKAAKAYENYYDDVKKVPILLKLYNLYKTKVDKPKGLRDVLEKLVRIFPNKFNYVLELADAYVETGQTKKAVKVFEKILKKNPNHAKANLYTGMALADKRKYKRAKKKLEVGLKKYPNNYIAWELLAECYESQENTKAAKIAYKRAEEAKARK